MFQPWSMPTYPWYTGSPFQVPMPGMPNPALSAAPPPIMGQATSAQAYSPPATSAQAPPAQAPPAQTHSAHASSAHASGYEDEDYSSNYYSESEETNDNVHNRSFDDNLALGGSGKRDEARLHGFKLLFLQLQLQFPDKFVVQNAEGPYYESRHRESGGTDNIPMLLVKPLLSGSWLDPPFKAYPSDTSKFWDDSVQFPSTSRINPKEYSLAAKRSCPYLKFEDEDLHSFLTGKPFKKISLDTAAFDRSSVDLSGSSASKVDTMLRPALKDSYVNDELLKIMFGLVSSLEPVLRDDLSSSSKLDLLTSCLEMTAENNQRTGQAVLAALVTNKLSLRENVLRRFQVPKYSGTLLKGSDFKSDKLFGPLPESFKASLLTHSGKELRCSSRTSTTRSYKPGSNYYSRASSSAKRSSSSALTPAKRFKRGGSTAKFFRGKNRKRN